MSAEWKKTVLGLGSMPTGLIVIGSNGKEINVAIPEEEVETEMINPTVTIVEGSTDLPENYARYDAPSNTLTVALPVWVRDWKLNIERFNEIVSETHTTIPASAIGGGFVDMSFARACKSYIPSRADIADGAVQVSDFPYARATIAPLCINVELNPRGLKTTSIPCGFAGNCVSCNHYVAMDWETTTSAFVADEEVFALQVVYHGARVPTWRITNTEGTYTTSVDALSAFSAKIIELQSDGTEVIVMHATGEVARYFDTVLAV